MHMGIHVHHLCSDISTVNMYTHTWFAHSVFDEDEDLILLQDTKLFDNRDNCIQAALLDKPLSPLSYWKWPRRSRNRDLRSQT